MSSGRLMVRVFTSRAQIPIPGATVVVTHRLADGMRELLGVRTTDSSGNTQPIEIDSPDLFESQSPEGTNPGYSVCDVWAEHPGFSMLVVEDVQIFPGVETFQPMELSPLAEGENSLSEVDVQETPPQGLR